MAQIDYDKEMKDTLDIMWTLLENKNYRKVRDYAKHLLNLLDKDKASKKIANLVLKQK